VWLLLAWFLGLRHASYRVFLLLALALAALGGTLFWMSTQRMVAGPYTPAHWRDGRIVPGRAP
jgi:hypothetical protein